MKSFDLSVYLVLDPDLCGEVGMVETARRAALSGATMVQLRHKTASSAEMTALGLALMDALAGTGAKLIVNDDVAAAMACGAHGVHVGQGDMATEKARALIGPDMILGLSVETPARAAAADPALVDYVGAGPVFATITKTDHEPAVGFEGLAAQVAATDIPAVAIGGVKASHAKAVIDAGAEGLAVVSAICGQADIEKATQQIVDAVRKAKI
ncbi:MAG: thiamine phosphate synthase [Pikeienuella sp.]